MRPCLEAAKETKRILVAPEAICLLSALGERSIDLSLRFLINDPQNGIANGKSDVLLAIWDKFHAHGVEIPCHQRDVHVYPHKQDDSGEEIALP
ncbi:MAG: hypothetical protein PHI06_08085 [Desulfobulbaceae bacterium]|nr:hypothetical protein [Desulfobulbaceae bacterium]